MLRICTLVFTTSNGVVSAATTPPAKTPQKKFTPSVSRGVSLVDVVVSDNSDGEEEDWEEKVVDSKEGS